MPSVRIRQRTIARYDPPLLISGDAGVVLTPEGRVALEQLRHFESLPSGVSLSLHDEQRLVDQYREWSQSHVRAVVGARGIRPPALALVVLLLLVDARDMHSALLVDRKMSTEADCALREVLLAFVRMVSTKPPSLKDPIWTWPISRAQARFDGVRRHQPAEAPERFWIEADMRQRTLEDVAAELVPRPRVRSVDHALGAVQTLAQAFDEQQEILRSAGICAPPIASRQVLYDELRLAFTTVSQ
jgi:hypothetical protein